MIQVKILCWLTNKSTLLLVVLLMLGACAKKASTSGTKATSPTGYSEDLSVWRPEEPVDSAKSTAQRPEGSVKVIEKVEPKFASNQKLDPILDSIAEVNLQNGYIDGFTIQVYSGIKREDALNAKKDLSTYMPDLESEIQYVQPNFRVRSGKYPGRIEAQKDYQEVKRYFLNAILIPERIPIN